MVTNFMNHELSPITEEGKEHLMLPWLNKKKVPVDYICTCRLN